MLKEKEIILIATLLGGSFLAVLNQMLTTSALPVIMADLLIDASLAQWLTSGYTLVYAMVIPLSAYLMRRFRTKPLFLGAYLFLFTGSIIAALAPDFTLLLAGRLLQAVCVGVLTPVVMTVVMLTFPLEKRGFAMGLANLVVGIAPALGPLFAGALADLLGWRAMFVAMSCLSALVIIVAFFVLPDFGKSGKAHLDVFSVVLSSFGLATLLYGFSSFSLQPVLSIALAIVGLLLLFVFARRQLHAAEPILDVRIFGVREFCFGAIAVMIMQGLFMAASSVVPLLVQGGLGGSATESGAVVLPGALLGAVLSLLAGRLFDLFGVRFPAILGLALMALGLGGLALVGSCGLVTIAVCMAGVSCGSVLTFTPLLTWGANAVGEDRLAHANAISNTLRQASSAFGTALFVSLMSLSAGNSGLGGAGAQIAGASFSFLVAFVLAVLTLIVVAFGTHGAGKTIKVK